MSTDGGIESIGQASRIGSNQGLQQVETGHSSATLLIGEQPIQVQQRSQPVSKHPPLDVEEEHTSSPPSAPQRPARRYMQLQVNNKANFGAKLGRILTTPLGIILGFFQGGAKYGAVGATVGAGIGAAGGAVAGGIAGAGGGTVVLPVLGAAVGGAAGAGVGAGAGAIVGGAAGFTAGAIVGGAVGAADGAFWGYQELSSKLFGVAGRRAQYRHAELACKSLTKSGWRPTDAAVRNLENVSDEQWRTLLHVPTTWGKRSELVKNKDDRQRIREAVTLFIGLHGVAQAANYRARLIAAARSGSAALQSEINELKSSAVQPQASGPADASKPAVESDIHKPERVNADIANIDSDDDDDDGEVIGPDFADPTSPTIVDAIKDGYVYVFDKEEMNKIKDEMLARIDKDRFPKLTNVQKFHARQFIQQTLEDWNAMVSHDFDMNGKLRRLPPLYEVFDQMEATLVSAQRVKSRSALTREFGQAGDKFAIVADGEKAYKTKYLGDLAEDARKIEGDEMLVTYFKKLSPYANQTGELNDKQVAEVQMVVSEFLEKLRSLPAQERSALTELDKALGNMEMKFNQNMNESFLDWMEGIAEDWKNGSCGKEQVDMLARLMGSAVKILS